MPRAGLSAALARARRAAAPDPASDGRLLGAFAASRDADAFAALVERFGPMVFAVCRRLTGHHQDAEDAFQAAFVVLARRAATIRSREAVGGWLYRVAVRLAREARAVSARRLAREAPTHPLPHVARPDPEADDLAAVLHEELAELPDKFRTLVVLCDLRGEGQAEVAARLGVPPGTVYSRLATARRLLADRLRKRGVALPAAGLAACVAGAGRAAVPPGLPARAVAAALSPESAPAAVAALSNGVVRTMYVLKLTTGAACGLLLALTGLGAWAGRPGAPAEGPAAGQARTPAPRAADRPARKVSGPVAYKDLMLVLATGDGAAAVVFHDPEDGGNSVSYKFRYESADGKTTKAGGGKLYERRLGGDGGFDPAGLTIAAGPIAVEWSRGGADRGWVYYAPEAVGVHLAHAADFEDRAVATPAGPHELKKLDLRRYMRK